MIFEMGPRRLYVVFERDQGGFMWYLKGTKTALYGI